MEFKLIFAAAWSKNYSGQDEIYAYLQGVARKYGLYEQTKFRTEVIRAQWMGDIQKWQLDWRCTDGSDTDVQTGFFDFVFAGLGPLRIPKIPEQFKSFTGKAVHTAEWDPTIDFAGKRVAVVGSGASAIQVVPVLTKTVGHLYSYQRTPAWTLPRNQFSYGKLVKFIFRWFPFVMRFYRFLLYATHESYYVMFGYYNSFIGRRIHWLFEKLIAFRLKRAGRPDLIPVLTPKFAPGCKRIAKSEEYLEALAQTNVTVVPSAVEKVEGTTIIDNHGQKNEIDILVLATGFNVEGFIGNLQIVGRDNQSLSALWRSEFPKTFKSVTVNGFPNFFLLLGPTSGLGHNSVVSIIECQVNFAIELIKRMMKKGVAAVEPKVSSQDAFVSKLQRDMKHTVWNSGCASWYKNEKGEITGLWSGTVASFWWTLRNPQLSDFIEYKKPLLISDVKRGRDEEM
ncbi:hypothetical protein DFQ28_005980 [Apophysomyces sp. BC1034]|nr:hypothetical protein DFQ30_002573 [Apophysomyces sp. BC1015]KAG0177376.1 hypothetical protein DFQ29_004924 [Apophysomyces sp. BC1021]KAG0187668.1 hypothetical protein DFQ28_005980 [Apophysomyces sp. BC1034]